MKTITIKVPDFLNDRLDAAAAKKHVSKSEIVREALLQIVSDSDGVSEIADDRPSIHRRLKQYQGAGETGIHDLASNPSHLKGYGHK